jgi:peptidoglycan/LPS O-acetylase OafA/YrhL
MADTSQRHIEALDGIRGFAVILVFIYHVFLTWVTVDSHFTGLLHGLGLRCWIGVDLFFILSGFLITGILLRAKDATNYYRVFYARRALRILPLYYLVLFGPMLLFHVHPPIRFQIWYWLNVSNIITAFYPMLIPWLAHYWSLAIEEQFYFAWPALVRKVSPMTLARLCVALIVSCFLLRNLPIVLAWNHRWPNFVYRLTPFRIDTLCSGALLAVLAYKKIDFGRYRWHLRAGCTLGAALFAISSFRTDWVVRFGFTGLTLCFTGLLALVLNPKSLTAKIFANGFLRRMGTYSYCFYLIHTFVLLGQPFVVQTLARGHLITAFPSVTELLAATILFTVTFGLCAISYRFFESPILGLKRYVPYRYAEYPQALAVSSTQI